MKKSGKKLLGILLTASITAATVFPIQAAAEPIDREIENVTQTGDIAAPNETPPDYKTDHAADSSPQADHTADSSLQADHAADSSLQTEDPVAADTPSENDPVGTGDSITQTEDPVSAGMEAESYGISPQAASYDINQPVIESFKLLENGKTVSVDDTVHFEMSAYDTESGIKTITVSLAGYNHYDLTLQHIGGNIYTGSIPCNRLTSSDVSVYVNRIRVEDYAGNYIDGNLYDTDGKMLYTFDVVQKAQVAVSNFQMQTSPSGEDGKLRPGDTVTFTALVECTGGILKNTGSIMVETCDGTSHKTAYGTLTYNTETKMLEAVFTVQENTLPTDWRLYTVQLSTTSGKYFSFYPESIEPDTDLTFTVANDDYDTEKPVIESITIDKNGETVKAGDQVTIKVKVSEENPSSWMDVSFSQDNSNTSGLGYSLYLNRTTMEYYKTIPITDDTYPAKWVLNDLKVSDQNGNTATLSDFREDWDTARPWYFTVDPEGYFADTEKPVIESITIDKNGQWVQPGETVTLTVKVDEENPSPRASATFSPQVSYVIGAFDIYLNYQEDIKSYVGAIPITNDTYPCEWTLTSLSITDLKGHYTDLPTFMSNWSKTCPWYYRVKSGNTFREDVKDVTFDFYGFAPQEDGSLYPNSLILTKTIKNVGRRASLKDLGLSLPQPPEGVTAKWLNGWNGPEIDENTQLPFFGSGDTYRSYYATYDLGCLNVYLTYMTKDKGIQTVMIPHFTGKETTYLEALNTLPLPEDAEEAGFSGLKLKYDYGDGATVGDVSYVYAEAEYNNSLVAWHTRYLDEKGNEISKVIPKSYEKGTAVSDALAALEAPEGIGNLEFDHWVLTGPEEADIFSNTMETRYVTAVYHGKTVADISYTYRNEDGKLTDHQTLMLINGENLSDAAVQGEATSAFKGVTHLNGLMLYEWKGTIEKDLNQYKKINFQALYYNCVAILKYPDETYQYVILKKGSSFTLPTENETYRDILWEGYEKGETVTVTEDREFLAASAVRKDGAVEGPSGIKLTEEEINKIISEIDQTEAGATLHVDMKKATVVPKEVLEAIQGKEINIVLDMGAYSWSIGGTEVAATDLTDIDLEITLDTDAIPSSLVDSIAEGKPSTQISLTHNGEFGFRADLTLNLGSEHSGETGNLYYYDSSGKLVFRNAGEISADGSISLSFSHASDYVVVIDAATSEEDNSGSEEEPSDSPDQTQPDRTPNTPSIEKTTAPAPDVKQEEIPNEPKSPKTGE